MWHRPLGSRVRLQRWHFGLHPQVLKWHFLPEGRVGLNLIQLFLIVHAIQKFESMLIAQSYKTRMTSP
jgi:hypothetical protein